MNATPTGGGFAGRFLWLATVSLVGIGVAMAAGYLPTRRLAGDDGVQAMWLAGGVVLLANWLGILPLCTGSGSGPQQVNRMLGSTALRMFLAVGFTVAAALAKIVPLKPLLLWVAIGYMVSLAGETVAVVMMTRTAMRQANGKRDERTDRVQ